MAKFNYKQWVVENKYGKLEEDVHGSSKAQGLSTIDPETADATIGGGAEDGDKADDQVAGSKVSIAVSQLKPAQTEIILVKAFNMALNTKGVGTSIYYPHPLPRMNYYKNKYKLKIEKFKNARIISDFSIALPVGPHISSSQVKKMSNIINSVLSKYE